MFGVHRAQKAIYYDKHFSSEDEAIREKVKTIAGQTTFLCSAFCIIMMPEGQLIHWNLPSVGGGNLK